jgi:Tetrapyrrole (Corrin/Porphyrin) Methylases
LKDLLRLEREDAIDYIIDAYRSRKPVPLPPSKGGRLPANIHRHVDAFSYLKDVPLIGSYLWFLVALWMQVFTQIYITFFKTIERFITVQDVAGTIQIKVSNECIADSPKLKEVVKGSMYLVGSGPGNPEYLVSQAYNLLKTADLVVSDRLISPSILALVPPSNLFMAITKANGTSELSQENTNKVCLEALNEGKLVVRLKSGDPMLYGRGAEEVSLT